MYTVQHTTCTWPITWLYIRSNNPLYTFSRGVLYTYLLHVLTFHFDQSHYLYCNGYTHNYITYIAMDTHTITLLILQWIHTQSHYLYCNGYTLFACLGRKVWENVAVFIDLHLYLQLKTPKENESRASPRVFLVMYMTILIGKIRNRSPPALT